MKKNIQILFSLFVLGMTALSFSACEEAFGIRGKGDVITEIRDVKNFHALDISGPGDVELRVDSVYRVEVSCEETIIDYLETVEQNGVLKIHFDRDVYDVDHLKITVSAPAWDGVEVSGSADVQLPDAITGAILKLGTSGSGDIKVFQADFNKIIGQISGSGDISIDGEATELLCSITGSGNFDALGCPVLTATVNITGSGDARVDVSESLDITITGSGDVEYRGNPKVSKQVSGSGTVRKI